MAARSFDHRHLAAYRHAILFFADAGLIAAALPKGWSDLANQLRRASTSILLNIAEGAGEFAPAEKARFYRMARRSATECAAIVDAFAALRPNEGAIAARAVGRLEEIAAVLTTMIRNRAPEDGDQPRLPPNG